MPLSATGESTAVTLQGGTLLHPIESVKVRALPDRLPQVIEYPVESLGLRAVCAVTPTDVWAVGERGSVLRHNGNLARVTAAPATNGALYGVWGKRSDSVWVAGEAGAFHFDGDGLAKQVVRLKITTLTASLDVQTKQAAKFLADTQ